ncbi:MAG TPA: anthranilate synthase component I family protein [Candidatus Krumholzibacteria bacterium]|nr:anthranilate synthase component I family protein [Candidatus Krumholzibacteria bacterium]
MTTTLDLQTDPLDAAATVANRPGTVLLHSGHRRGRSVLLFGPRWTLTCGPDGRPRWSGDAPDVGPLDPDPLRWPSALNEHLAPAAPEPDVPWMAGALSFEAGTARFGARSPVAAPFSVPEVWLAAYDHALVFDPGRPARLVVHRDRDARATVLDALRTPAARRLGGGTGAVRFFDRDWHRDAVGVVREHLLRGDVYQINLTGFARAESSVDPFEGFRREARGNPTPLAAYLRLEGATITSHSPERLLRRRGDRVSTGPIKGTAPAGSVDALRASEKDRAEHVMIVDLCRNDLGRIARPGTVRVDPLMATLRARGLIHLVSDVHARLVPSRGHELLGALFPGGSITGAPKRRACEIIAAVETAARGPYTGAIGAVAPNGDMDWSIAIRTAVWQDGAVHFGTGGGIVLDSDPDREYEEARLKARSFFASLGAAV